MWILLAFYFINSFVRGIGFLLIYSWLQASSIMIWVVTLANVNIHPKDSIGGGGSTARRARSQTARSKSTAWGRDERHYSLGLGQSSRIDDHAFLSWRARETGNESTVGQNGNRRWCLPERWNVTIDASWRFHQNVLAFALLWKPIKL